MKQILIEEHAGDVLVQAINAYIKHAEENENTNADGSILTSADRVEIEAIATAVEHSSNQSIGELLYSGLNMELGEDGTIELVREKVSDDTLLEAIDDGKITEYYDANLKPAEPTTPIETPEVTE